MRFRALPNLDPYPRVAARESGVLARVARGSALIGGALMLIATVPRPVAAARVEANASRADRSPQERALAGGVVHLRAPASRMILILRSTFAMGSSPTDVLDAAADCAREPLGQSCQERFFSVELPQHRVTLSSYWLDRTEVTVEDYGRCVALRRCRSVRFAEGARRFDSPRYPVSLVTYEDAETYCRFRRARLPTEAEFERAARGGEGRRFPWGEVYNSRAANHGRLGWSTTDDVDGYVELAPVGALPAGRTPDGFLDLAGNVAEWVSDRYAPGYPEGDAVDPTGPATAAAASERVVRGGHFSSAAPWLRGAARSSAEPSARAPYLGFRCARSAERRREARKSD